MIDSRFYYVCFWDRSLCRIGDRGELSNFGVIFMSVHVEGLGLFYLPESVKKAPR